jgi:Surface-adhesin protein E
LGIALIGFIIIGYVEVWGADWILYSSDDEEKRCYDPEGIVRPSENTIEVWLRVEYTNKGVKRMTKEFGKKYENIGYTMALVEIKCLEKKIQTLSLIRYSKGGNIISSSSRSVVWQYFAPGSLLYEAVCT